MPELRRFVVHHSAWASRALAGLTLAVAAFVGPPPAAVTGQTAAPPSSHWTMASLSEPRSVAAVVTVDGKAALVSTHSPGLASRALDIYDPASGSLTSISLRESRLDPFVIGVGTRVLVAGSGSSPRTVDSYDTATGATDLIPLTLPPTGAPFSGGSKVFFPNPSGADIYDANSGGLSRADLRPFTASAAVGRLAIFARAAVGSGAPGTQVDLHDTVTGTWRTVELARPRSAQGVVALDEVAVFAGGDVYDAATDRWTTPLSLTGSGEVAYIGAVGGKALFVFGQRADVYDPATRQWSSFDLPGLERVALSTVGGTRLALLGGNSETFPPRDAPLARCPTPAVEYSAAPLYVYDAADNSWRSAYLDAGRHLGWFTPAPANADRKLAGALAIAGDQVLVAGGAEYLRGGGVCQYSLWQPSTAVDIYNLASDEWSQAQLEGGASFAPAALVVGDTVTFSGKDRVEALGLHHGEAASPMVSQMVDVYSAATGAWSAISLSEARTGLRGGTVGSLAVFAGGRTSGFLSDPAVSSLVVDIYDPRMNTWRSTTVPSGVSHLLFRRQQVMVVGSRLVLFDQNGNVAIYDTRSDSWSSAQIERARSIRAIAVVGQKVLFAGATWESPRVDIYDATTGEWAQTELSQARGWVTTAVVGSTVLFAGGRIAFQGAASDVVDLYDTRTGLWSTAQLSAPRSDMAAAVVGNKVLVAGGDLRFGDRGTAVDIYDSESGQWSVASLSGRNRNAIPQVAVVADKVLFSQVRFPNPFVDVYDARADAWTVRRLPQNRAEIEVAAVGTQVLFVSGQAGQGPSAAVDIFEGTTGNWKSAALSAARRGPAVAVVGGKVIVAGGRGPDPSSAVDIYDSSNDSWTVDRLPVARGVISAAAAANSVVFAGGSVGEPISYSGWVDILRVSE